MFQTKNNKHHILLPPWLVVVILAAIKKPSDPTWLYRTHPSTKSASGILQFSIPQQIWKHLPSRGLIPAWEKENHLQSAIFGGYVSFLEGTYPETNIALRK